MAYTPREGWSSLDAKVITPHPMTTKGDPVSLIVLHHTVTSPSPFYAVLAAIQRNHLSGKYHDIAYNGAASNASDDFTDLRGPLRQGGATGENRDGRVVDEWSLSIVVPGDFETAGKDNPTAKAIENTAQLIALWHSQGHVADDFTVEPHRDHYQLSNGTPRTSCCGRRLLAVIPQIEARAQELIKGDDEMAPMIEWWRTFNRTEDGDESGVIEWFQRGLAELGFYDGRINGKQAPRLRAAWLEFERSLGHPNPNDKAGAATLQHFIDLLAERSADGAETAALEEANANLMAAQAAILAHATKAQNEILNVIAEAGR